MAKILDNRSFVPLALLTEADSRISTGSGVGTEMPWYDIAWNEEIADHLAAHGVSREDFEWVVSDPDSDNWSRSRPDRRIAWGYTEDGRYIACIYEPLDDRVTIIPVTAYETREPRW